MVPRRPSRSLLILLGLGLYLSLRGYESLDGDQAYRLPLLLHLQDPSLYANDPFVRAFDTFNPHSGYLTLLDLTSRPFGLSVSLFALFAATFTLTAIGIDRLARLAWPNSDGRAGIFAVILVLVTRAGNIGTNHLFEPVLLDRLIALALAWNALASILNRPSRGAWTAPVWLAVASWVHPSLGLQFSLLLGAWWIALALLPTLSRLRIRPAEPRPPGELRTALIGLTLLVLAMLPQLLRIPSQSATLLQGMTPDAFLLWTAQVQSPQHMLPHLWRDSQWAAWFGFLVLAGLTLLEKPDPTTPTPRAHLWTILSITLLGLLLGWIAVESLHLWKITVFQPFRMATVARGLALILTAGRVDRLWTSRSWLGTVRVALLIAGLTSDLAFVVVVLSEVAFALGAWSFRRSHDAPLTAFLGLGVLALGLIYLHRVDTDSGTARLILGAVLGLSACVLRRLPLLWTPARQIRLLSLSWLIPLFALLVPRIWPHDPPRWASPILDHCRLSEIPSDPPEKLALWARLQIPPTARIVVPPREKTFRLWSRRSVSFNRAASPYHAQGLLDWSHRYRDHVGFYGSPESFAQRYLADHLALEQRYEEFSASELAALARRQHASHVLASSSLDTRDGSLQKLRAEGDYALYRVSSRREIASRSEVRE